MLIHLDIPDSLLRAVLELAADSEEQLSCEQMVEGLLKEALLGRKVNELSDEEVTATVAKLIEFVLQAGEGTPFLLHEIYTRALATDWNKLGKASRIKLGRCYRAATSRHAGNAQPGDAIIVQEGLSRTGSAIYRIDKK